MQNKLKPAIKTAGDCFGRSLTIESNQGRAVIAAIVSSGLRQSTQFD